MKENPSQAAAGPPSAQQQQPMTAQEQAYTGHIVLACIVTWCCNWLFGLAAYQLASEYSLQSTRREPRLHYFIITPVKKQR